MNLCVGSGAANLLTSQGAPLNHKARFLAFNFNSPCNDPNPTYPDPVNALPLGIVQDRQGEVHVHYYLGAVEDDGLRRIHSIQELPDDGVFYQSERTGLILAIGGVRHRLVFGSDSWPLSFCRPEEGSVYSALGTTKVQISRQGDTYTLQATARINRAALRHLRPVFPCRQGVIPLQLPRDVLAETGQGQEVNRRRDATMNGHRACLIVAAAVMALSTSLPSAIGAAGSSQRVADPFAEAMAQGEAALQRRQFLTALEAWRGTVGTRSPRSRATRPGRGDWQG